MRGRGWGRTKADENGECQDGRGPEDRVELRDGREEPTQDVLLEDELREPVDLREH